MKACYKNVFFHIFFILGILLTACTPSKEVALSLNPSLEGAYTGNITLNQTILQEISGREIKSSQFINYGFQLRGKKKSPEGILLEVRFTDISLKMDDLQMNMNYSTNQQSSHPAIEILRAFTKEAFTLTLSENGVIEEITGIQDTLDYITLIYQVNPIALSTINTILNEKQIKQNFEHLFCYFPGRLVRTGDQWQTSQLFSLGYSINLENQWRLSGLKEDSAEIKLKGSLSSPSFEITGTRSGSVTVDLATGLAQNGRLAYSFEGNSPGPRNEPIGMKIESEVFFSITGTVPIPGEEEPRIEKDSAI